MQGMPGLARGPVSLSPLTPPMPPVFQMQQTRNRNNRNIFLCLLNIISSRFPRCRVCLVINHISSSLSFHLPPTHPHQLPCGTPGITTSTVRRRGGTTNSSDCSATERTSRRFRTSTSPPPRPPCSATERAIRTTTRCGRRTTRWRWAARTVRSGTRTRANIRRTTIVQPRPEPTWPGLDRAVHLVVCVCV